MARHGRPTVEIIFSDEERSTLERWARRHSSSQAVALRSKIVLAAPRAWPPTPRSLPSWVQSGDGGQMA